MHNYFFMQKKAWSFLLVENISIAEPNWYWKYWRWKGPREVLSTSMDVTIWKRTALTISKLWRLVLYSSLIVSIVLQLTPTWLLAWQLNEGLKETEMENIWIALEKMTKGKRKFGRKRKRCKLSTEEMGVIEKLKIVRLLL